MTDQYLIIGITAFVASVLTFFSGFGLGTLLTVAFLRFFPIKLAIALTAVVHLANNIFKALIMRKTIDRSVLIAFGITAIVGAFLGSLLLGELPNDQLAAYSFNGETYRLRSINLLVSLLLTFFAVAELLPILHFKVKRKILPVGGFLSGFFGGLSGHQGALRSSFLMKLGLTKEAFVGTGIAVSLLIDVSRLTVYRSNIDFDSWRHNWDVLLVAILPALAGAIVGKLFLKKITYQTLQVIVAIGIIVFSIALGAGWIDK